MKLRGFQTFLFCALGFLLNAAPASAQQAAVRELAISEVLRYAEMTVPEIKAAAARESQARQAVETSKSAYYPSIFAQSIKGYGLPASNGALGISGVMGSPYEKGLSGGFLAKATFFDLGREFAVRSARQKLEAVRQEQRVARYKIYNAALSAYFNAVRNKGQQQAWHDVAIEVDGIAQKVDEFVRTGQHSVAEQLLLQDQVIDAAMNRAVYSERYRWALKQISLLTGLDENAISCPEPAAIKEKYLEAFESGDGSPLVAKAAAEASAARTGIKERMSEHYPKLQGLGSFGGYKATRGGAPYENYSAGIALTLPLFEGFRVSSLVDKAKAFSEEKDREVDAAKLDLSQANARYDEIISLSKIKLLYLDNELSVAKEALNAAFRRYTDFEGPLNEVREAIRNLARVSTQLNDANADLLQALGSKAILNGAVLR